MKLFLTPEAQAAKVLSVAVQFDSLSLWERVGVRAFVANCNHNVAAGFSPQSV